MLFRWAMVCALIGVSRVGPRWSMQALGQIFDRNALNEAPARPSHRESRRAMKCAPRRLWDHKGRSSSRMTFSLPVRSCLTMRKLRGTFLFGIILAALVASTFAGPAAAQGPSRSESIWRFLYRSYSADTGSTAEAQPGTAKPVQRKRSTEQNQFRADRKVRGLLN